MCQPSLSTVQVNGELSVSVRMHRIAVQESAPVSRQILTKVLLKLHRKGNQSMEVFFQCHKELVI